MTRRKVSWGSSVLLVLLLSGGCALPRMPVRQTFVRQSSVSAGETRIHLYTTVPFSELDSSAALLRQEFLPVSIYAVADSRDTIRDVFIVAWQEYLWRFSERLAPLDKDYFAPLLGSMIRRGDTLQITWAYPSVDARDDDLRQITAYRNSYWSVDRVEPGTAVGEVYGGILRSHPQYGTYRPSARFQNSGTFELALPDSSEAMDVLRRLVEDAVVTLIDAEESRR